MEFFKVFLSSLCMWVMNKVLSIEARKVLQCIPVNGQGQVKVSKPIYKIKPGLKELRK
jgi:hypothetical protein